MKPLKNRPPYRVVSTLKDLKKVVRLAKKTGPAALDFETASLYASEGRVRTCQLYNKRRDVSCVIDFDRIKGGFRRHAKLFEGGQWIVFFAGFEMRWFLEAGVDHRKIDVMDVANLRKAHLGGGIYSLKQTLAWDIEVEMSKEEQVSNWAAKELTQSQLNYAFDDAWRTWELWLHWYEKSDEGHLSGFRMFDDMVPAVIEMEESGMRLDKKRHAKLVAHWEDIKAAKVKGIREMVPEEEVANINSDRQWSDYFAANLSDDFLKAWPRTEKSGQLQMTNKTLKMLAGFVTGTPLEEFFDLLAEYKTIAKYISSFGQTLITKADQQGDRLHARYNIGAAKTGRFSSSGPNLQQVPRDKELLDEYTSVRSSFIAGLGRKLISLDYSGIELRVLALLAGDWQLLEDMVTGDVHAEVGAYRLGRPLDLSNPADKAVRQSCKAVSFGIVYGIGAPGLSGTMRTGIAAAQAYIDFWAHRYPEAFGYRHQIMEEARKTGFCRAIDGGTIWLSRRPDLPKAANYPVQRAALSVMAKSIKRHKLTLDAQRDAGKQRMTRMLSSIHDALIDEASSRDASACLRLMEKDMTDGYLDIFPDAPTERLVEGGTGPNWAELD